MMRLAAMLDKDPENINGGCGIGGHNKMARGTEDRERKDWEHYGVKPSYHGMPAIRA